VGLSETKETLDRLWDLIEEDDKMSEERKTILFNALKEIDFAFEVYEKDL
jgi:hypothetical protein